jgi:nitrogen fixation protein FixH
MSRTDARPSQPTKARAGSWIPWIFIAGFGVVLVANGTLIYVAASTWTGIAVNRAYDKGLTYNRNLEAAARQAALGWESTVNATVTADLTGTVEVALRDASGAPLNRAEVVVQFERPTHEGHDFMVQLAADGAGSYAAPFAAPLPGVWDLRLIATRGDDRYVTAKRVVLR